MTAAPAEVATLHGDLVRDGFVGLPGCFPPQWADALHADFNAAFDAARSHRGGTVDRGPHRHYFAVHPERIRGFVDLATHPLVIALSTAVLGADYEFVEVAFDVPLPGAVDQPWHRDFPMPPETRVERALSSLAFNITTVDVIPDLAPFEFAPGTHWDVGDDFVDGMFPPAREVAARYGPMGRRMYPRRGDVSARSGLTLHRGTANRSARWRAVLILGVVAADVAPSDVHQLVLTAGYHDRLPERLRRHLRCTVVDELQPLPQRHDIDGLRTGG
jgi:hypothetical protein